MRLGRRVSATILVVDDEEAIRGLLVNLLEDEGYLVVAARNGRAALEAIADAPPNLVITDLMMPELDGRELIRRLQARPEWSQIPVILLSAALPDRGAIPLVGVFVSKPFDLDALLAIIATALNDTN